MNFFKNLKIQEKLFLGLGLIILQFVLFAFWSYKANSRLEEDAGKVKSITYPSIISTFQLINEIDLLQRKFISALDEGDGTDLDKISFLGKNIEKDFSLLRNISRDKELDLLEEAFIAYFDRGSKAVKKLINDLNDDEVNLSELSETAKNLKEKLETFQAKKEKEFLFTINQTIETASNFKLLFFPILLLFLFIVFLFSFFFTRSITLPIKKSVTAIEKISKGDLSGRVEIINNDEIGQMAFAFNSMAGHLEEHQSNLEKINNLLLEKNTELDANIVELKKAREEIKEQNRTLEIKVEEKTKELQTTMGKLFQSEKMSAIGQLAGGVAHEINNPMGVILGFSQSIVRRLKVGDPLEMPLKSIEREAVRCKKLVGDLLTFSRSGKSEDEKFNPNDSIEQTLTLVEAQAKVAGVEIIRNFSPSVSEVLLNRSQFQQVIVNICTNGIQAMPQGGTLAVKTSLEENQLIVIVSDTGTGMTEEVKKHLFEPFFTTKEVGNGTGLGLSLCYEIVKNNFRGSIEVKSEIGKGSQFIINIPLI